VGVGLIEADVGALARGGSGGVALRVTFTAQITTIRTPLRTLNKQSNIDDSIGIIENNRSI
jgi:hypothetical protein